MSLLFADSFDWTTNASIAVTKYASGFTASVVSGTPRTGSGCITMTTTGLTTFPLPATSPTAIVGVAVFLDAYPISATWFLRALEGATVHMELGITTAGKLYVARNGTTLATGATSVPINSWFFVEFKTLIHDTTGTTEVHLDTVAEAALTLTGQDTRNGGTGQWDTVRLVSPSSSITFRMDDVYVCDGAGSSNNDFLGALKWECKIAQSDATGGVGSNRDFTPSTGTDHGALVDETTPNDDTDYLSSSTVGHIETLNFAALSLAGAIKAVAVNGYMKKTDAGARTVKAVTRVGGTNYTNSGAAITPTTGYGSRQQIWDLNPNSGVAWLTADVDGAEFGWKIES